MPQPRLPLDTREVRLFRNGRNQAVRIPMKFALPGKTATMRREGDKLIIEPVRKTGLLALLDSWKPMDEPFPEIDSDLPPLRDIGLWTV